MVIGPVGVASAEYAAPTADGVTVFEEGSVTSETSGASKDRDERLKAIEVYIRRALEGRSITLVKEGADVMSRMPATLRLLKQLRVLTIQAEGRTASFQVTSVEDAYTTEGDGEKAFSRSLLESLTDSERERLVRVDYRSEEESQLCTVTFLETSCAARQTLLRTLKVLQSKALLPKPKPKHHERSGSRSSIDRSPSRVEARRSDTRTSQ